MLTTKQKIITILYNVFAKWLPESAHSGIALKLRRFFARRLLTKMGDNVNIERGARFSPEVQIGDNSGLGIRCEVNGPVIIGDAVMMGPEVVFHTRNHKHELGTLFYLQGFEETQPVHIGNNVWIGRRTMFMPGSSVGSNVVIAAGSIITKQFGDNVIIGGSPAKIIKPLE